MAKYNAIFIYVYNKNINNTLWYLRKSISIKSLKTYMKIVFT